MPQRRGRSLTLLSLLVLSTAACVGNDAQGPGGNNSGGSRGPTATGGGGSGNAPGGGGGGGTSTTGGGGATGGGGSTTTGTGGKGGATGSGGTVGTTGTGGQITNPDASVPVVDLGGRKALFIVSSPTSPDDGDVTLQQLLQIRGMTVTFATEAGPASMATGMNVVIASGSASAADFATTFKDVAVPMVLFGNGYF